MTLPMHHNCCRPYQGKSSALPLAIDAFSECGSHPLRLLASAESAEPRVAIAAAEVIAAIAANGGEVSHTYTACHHDVFCTHVESFGPPRPPHLPSTQGVREEMRSMGAESRLRSARTTQDSPLVHMLLNRALLLGWWGGCHLTIGDPSSASEHP